MCLEHRPFLIRRRTLKLMEGFLSCCTHTHSLGGVGMPFSQPAIEGYRVNMVQIFVTSDISI